MKETDQDVVKAELPAGVELNKPFRNPEGSGRKFSVYTKDESGDTVKVSFGDPDMEIRRDDPAARKAFRDRFSCDTDPGPKWKAKYWSCRMWDSESVTEILSGKMEKISAAFSAEPFDGKAPDEIVYMPLGRHEISASKNGKPAVVKVFVTRSVAEKFDAQLKQAIADAAEGKASRPFVDFQHEGGRAAAIPTGFSWNASKGIMLHLDWTASGRAAIEGRDFSYFSPEWVQSGEEPSSLALPGPVGGLVNTPAFQNLGKIAAALTTNPNMDELLQLFKDLGLVAGDVTEITPEVVAVIREKLTPKPEVEVEMEAMRAARVQADTDLVTARASIASLTAQLTAKEEAHAAALKAANESVAVKVAEIVKAAGVQTPVAASTLTKADPKTVTRAAFEKMPHTERNQFMRDGGKLTD